MVLGPSKARRCWTGEERSLGIGGRVVLFLAAAASASEASVTVCRSILPAVGGEVGGEVRRKHEGKPASRPRTHPHSARADLGALLTADRSPSLGAQEAPHVHQRAANQVGRIASLARSCMSQEGCEA